MPVRSYGFAIGNLRAKENALLKKTDLAQLTAAQDTDALCRLLKEKGIGDQAKDVPGLLREESEKLWRYISDNAPDMNAFAPFLAENDFHNYKAVLKAVICGQNYRDLLILPALTDAKVIERAVTEKRFDLLPEAMRIPAAEAYEVLLGTGDSQLCDWIIDAGCMTAQRKAAADSKNAIVKELITVTVFFNNIKAAIRAAKTGKSAAFLETTLTETGVVSKKAMKEAALSGEKALMELLQKATEVGGAQAAEQYKKSADAFERFCDDRLMQTAKKCKYITMGIEPLIGYMIARKAEIKDLRIIYSGVKTGRPQAETLERLRGLYD